MIRIVQPNADKFPKPIPRTAQSAAHTSPGGSAFASIMLNFFNDSATRLARNIRHHAAKIPGSFQPHLSSPAAPRGIPVPHKFHSVRSPHRNAPLRRGSLAALQARKCSKLVPHRAGRSGINYRVDDSVDEDSCSHRMNCGIIASQTFQKARISSGNPKETRMCFFESRIFGSHQTLPWHAAFGRFLAAYKSSHQTKIRSESRHAACAR